MVADSIAAVDRGFESLKIKVGKDIGVDIERVKAIYAAVEGRALLRLDANQGWTAKQAVYAIQTLEDAGCGWNWNENALTDARAWIDSASDAELVAIPAMKAPKIGVMPSHRAAIVPPKRNTRWKAIGLLVETRFHREVRSQRKRTGPPRPIAAMNAPWPRHA